MYYNEQLLSNAARAMKSATETSNTISLVSHNAN